MPLNAITHTFAGNPLDRASERRPDAEWLAGRLDDPDTRVLAMWNGAPLLTDGPAIAWLPGSLARTLARLDEHLLFLGLSPQGAVFAVDLDDAVDPAAGPLEGRGQFKDLRAIAPALSGPETGILATARALFEWHRRHRYCSVCGQPSGVVDGGWRRVCPACDAPHFPRVDPCVIMLPVFGERCLVGRQAAWDENRYSALAGFVEPGESLEEACAREVKEEARLTVSAVRHHSSQPWPYPANLMIGLIAEVADDNAVADQTELESVIWLTRQEARDAIEEKPGAKIRAPGPMAIAHHLIRAWAYGEV
jgi:NAD+ diphosphatase